MINEKKKKNQLFFFQFEISNIANIFFIKNGAFSLQVMTLTKTFLDILFF